VLAVHKLDDRGPKLFERRKLQKRVDAGDTAAMRELASLAQDSGDLEQAESWMRKAATHGDPNALTDLGMLLLHYRGDTEGAKALWLTEAENGNAWAMTNLGFLANQSGDAAMARLWWEKAAALENHGALHNLGDLELREGNQDRARELMLRSAEQGNTWAMHDLGLLLEEDGDVTAALTWYDLAARGGSLNALQRMHELGVLGPGSLSVDDRSPWINPDPNAPRAG
jgi:TPR repeat protein